MGRISGRMIVDENQAGGPFPECRTEYLPRMDQRSRKRARRHESVHEVVVLRIEVDRPEMLFVVVRSVKEIAGEERDGLGRA